VNDESRPEGRPHVAAPAKERCTGILAHPADAVAAELAALRRGEVPVCACCTFDRQRRNALDQLHAQDQIADIARALVDLIGVA
jgi:hypothetical protein